MNKGQILHGFRLISTEQISELPGKLHIYKHEGSGAELAFIDREDENKTFAISFKTLPEDDTGVFHILEHSVLCGSDKYPVKEPFVELLKTSLKTFLNAFTFPDKTMYPISSRNEKDFLNLTDVYMDAVFNPLARSKPEIFCQEGWHYEIKSKDEPLAYNGVVFNEMKGAYSSVDELETTEVAKMLYEGTPYGYDSGGDPGKIPTLTYSEFCAAHSKYYHPSNAKIILDGSVNLDAALKLLDGYLSRFSDTGLDFDIPDVIPSGHKRRTVEYEAGEGEDLKSKARMCIGFLATKHNERSERLAVSAIIDAIAGSNDAPFKKAMLDTGLIEDLSFFQYDGIKDNSLMLELKHFDRADADKLRTALNDTLKAIIDSGFDKEQLSAVISRMEFRAREQDGAGYPAGIANAISLLDGWLYGENPADALRFEENFKFLREALNTDYYERLFRRIVLEPAHSAELILTPSKTLGAERVREENARLAREKSAMTADELEKTILTAEAVERWQTTPDSKENLDTLPTLCLDDIEPLPRKREYVLSCAEGRDVVYTPVASKGITYIDILFDAKDLGKDGLFAAAMLCDILKNVKTKNKSAVKLQSDIKHHLGAMYFSVAAFERDGVATPYLKAHISCLDSKKAEACALLREVIYDSVLLGEEKVISEIVKQSVSAAREGIIASGHSAALGRIGAYFSEDALISEYTEGIEFYLSLKGLAESGDISGFAKKLDEVREKVFTRTRATIFYSGSEDKELPGQLISALNGADVAPTRAKLELLGKRREGIAIPSRVCYSCLGSNLKGAVDTDSVPGYFSVARSILSLGYLWNEVRVRGGAYGSGLTHRINGTAVFYSYRDPSPKRSLDIYRKSPEFLRSFAESGEDLTGFIIGTLGESDPLLTPKLISALTMRDFMRAEGYEQRAKRRREILATTHADLKKSADIIESLIELSGVCVVGSPDKLDECRAELDAIIEI